MHIETETHAEQVGTGWRDQDGFIGPYRPGKGPRTDPRGAFPTGPDIGELLPDIRCQDANGRGFDLHQERADRPAVVVFYRSAVW